MVSSTGGVGATLRSSGFNFVSSCQVKTAFHRIFPEEAKQTKLPAFSTHRKYLTHRS